MSVPRFRTIATALGITTLAGVAWLSVSVDAQSPHTHAAALAQAHALAAQHQAEIAGAEAHARAADEMSAALAEAGQDGGVARVLSVLEGRGSRLGVSIRDVNDDETKAGRTSGVVIEDVTADSPAATGGLKEGDIVTSFDGERVRSARQFSRLVDETPSGRSVKAQVMRSGSPVDLTVTPQAPEPTRFGGGMPGQHFEFRGPDGGNAFAFRVPQGDNTFEWRSDEPGPRLRLRKEAGPALRMMPEMLRNLDVELGMGRGRLGVGVQDLTPELAEYFGVKDGVLVMSVQKDGAAAKAGVKAGDVITSVDGSSVGDAAELRQRVWKDGEAADVALGISRDRKAQTLKVQLTAADEGKDDAEKIEKIEKKVIKRKV
jgi:C-terminal processing protease CtpA/Prc